MFHSVPALCDCDWIRMKKVAPERAESGEKKKKAKNTSSRADPDKEASEDEAESESPLKKAIRGEEMNDVELRDKKRTRKHSVLASEEVNKSKKMKKAVFDLPGQKRPTPSVRDPLRIFYETLYKQVPGCELAQIWMMESGLLSREEAQQVYEKTKSKVSTSLAVSDAAVETSVRRDQLPGKKKKKKRTETSVTVKKSRKHKDED